MNDIEWYLSTSISMQQLINQEQQPADYKSSVPETENYKVQKWMAQNTKTTTQKISNIFKEQRLRLQF